MDRADLEISGITFNEVKLAFQLIRQYIPVSPIVSAKINNKDIVIKLETILPTRNFKVRGALNALSHYVEEEAIARTCITASTGNHGVGLAFAARVLGIVAHIVLPKTVPIKKVEAIRQQGGQVTFYGTTFDEAEAFAHELERKNGWLYISSYEAAKVIAGQGTIALELVNQFSDVTMIVVPVGGGGLAGGIALACAHIAPQVKVIGVQSVSTPAMYNHLYGRDLPQCSSLANGLAGRVDEHSLGLALCRKYVQQVVLVEEEAIQMAMHWCVLEQGFVVEGSSACAVAALQSGALDWEGESVAVIASGGIVDEDTLQRIIC